MRPFRLLLSLTSCVLAITFLLYLSIADPSERATDPSDDESSKGGLGALFSFHGPLFPPSAIISLTDDNSTFFLARPAAFGPPLPSRGLSGELWIGNGFADNVYARGTFESSAEGELGCSDVPGWDEEYGLASRAGRVKTRSRHGPRPHRNIGARTEKLEAERWERSMLDDALHQTADIEGKIVLLSRGGCGFLDKVQWAQRRGGTAVVIGDNVRSGPIIRMYARGDTSNVSIPALFTSRTTAHLLSTLVPSDQSTSFFTKTRPYGGIHWDGQSAAAETHGAADTSQVGWFEWLFSSLGLSGKRHGVEAADGKRPASAELSIAGAKSRARVLRSRYYAAGSSRAYPTTSHVVHTQSDHEGLWVTLTPTSMSSNPFLDTLLVLVVSPLVTLTVVYALLLLRSRLQRRRWRAPKSIVERLPVRTYHTLPTASPSSVATPVATSPATPLLQNSHRRLSDASGPEAALPPEEHDTSVPSHQEKQQSSLSEWRRKFRGRQRECVVCLEEYEDGVSRVMSLPCGHEFHAECITPWLTTRRRTCPICKGDVVRSMARSDQAEPSSDAEPAATSHRRRHVRRPTSDSTSSSENLVSEEDIQTEAAIRRNDSPSAALPIPQARGALGDGLGLERDVEGGSQGAEDSQLPSESPPLWRRLGNLGLPGFGRPAHERQRSDQSDRNR